jgi:pyruvate-formate lyase
MAGTGAGQVLADLIEAYFESGGLQVQPNVVDINTLRDAKAHPEQHRDLLVRVTGYSAYFVTLSPENQEYIIARTAHSA